MTRPYRIAPSLLSANMARLGEEARRMELAGADWLHIDVFDGVFAPNLSFGPQTVTDLRSETRLFFDVHLMLGTPCRFLERFAKAGAEEMIVHVEAKDDVGEMLKEIRTLNCRVGLSLVPETPAETAFPYLELIDLILPMTVRPGFSGQKFMPEVLPKIARLRDEIRSRNLDVDIEADGGVSLETVPRLAEAGVNVFVAGSAVFGKPDAKTAMDELRKAMSHEPRSSFV